MAGARSVNHRYTGQSINRNLFPQRPLRYSPHSPIRTLYYQSFRQLKSYQPKPWPRIARPIVTLAIPLHTRGSRSPTRHDAPLLFPALCHSHFMHNATVLVRAAPPCQRPLTFQGSLGPSTWPPSGHATCSTLLFRINHYVTAR